MKSCINLLTSALFLLIGISLFSQSSYGGNDGIGQIDATIKINDSLVYLISDQKVTCVNIKESKGPLLTYKSLSEIFPSVAFKIIDAAVKVNKTTLLLFSGDDFLLFDLIKHEVISDYPKKIEEQWPALLTSHVSAAFKLDSERICILYNNNYFVINQDLSPVDPLTFYAAQWSLIALKNDSTISSINAAISLNSETTFFINNQYIAEFNTLGPGLISDWDSIDSTNSYLFSTLIESSRVDIPQEINTFSFKELDHPVRIHGYIQGLPDQKNEYSYEDVVQASLSSQFVKSDRWQISNSIEKEYCNWTRFKLHNDSQNKYELAFTYNNVVNVDSLHVFISHVGGSSEDTEFLRIGKLVPQSKKIFGESAPPQANTWAQSIYIEVEPQETLSFHIKNFNAHRMDNVSAWPLFMYQVSTKLDRYEFKTALDRQYVFPSIFLQGILWMLAIYVILLFMMNRDIAALLLGIFCISIALYAAIGSDIHSKLFFHAYILPNHPKLLVWGSPFLIGIAAASLSSFTRAFLNAKSISRNADRILRAITYLSLTYLLILVLFWLLDIDITNSWSIFLFIVLLLYGILIPFLAIQKNRLIYIILAGIVWVFIFLLPAQLSSLFGFFQNSDSIFAQIFTNQNITYIAALGQIVIYALSMGYRSKLIENEKLRFEELDKVKSRFFANISHEFRTPLTLILGPLEKIKSTLTKPGDLKLVRLAIDNARTLLFLVNQVLDLSKLENQHIKLKASKDNIVPFLKGIFFSFESLANQKNITQIFKSTEEEIVLLFDQQKMETIITNILSNAFKFSKEHDTIELELSRSKSTISIVINDSGPGIDAEKLPHIFDRFFQVEDDSTSGNNGSGIGLALVKELVHLHKGKISVHSSLGEGTSFELYFPLGQDHLSSDEILPLNESLNVQALKEESNEDIRASLPIDSLEPNLTSKKLPSILLIEDHKDVRSFIRSQLSGLYDIEEAENGSVGIEKALISLPDLIICDVMMPEKDGYQVCSILKQNIQTSHIPIILLTAKAARDEKIEGLQMGADDYLTKPFNTQELLARVHNLITLRRQLRNRFSSAIQITPSEVSINSVDQEFMQQALMIVENNMDNENFNIELMTKEIGMSSTQLNKKLRSLIDQSTNQFIKSIRLQRAADLLRQNTGSISEIAYMTGFRSVAYFSSTFKGHFGMTPRDYREGLKP